MKRGETGRYYGELLIEALREAGGRIESAQGLAQSTLVRAAGLQTGQASPVLARLVETGKVRRELKGKRVFWIELVEEEKPVVPATTASTAQVAWVKPEPPPKAELEPHAVAVALLDHVLDLIERPKQVAIDADRLSATLEENGRLRAQLRGLEQSRDRDRAQIEALGNERNGLRIRTQQLEANLRVATQDVKHVVDEEVRRRLAEFMQERPQLRAVKGDEK